MSSSPKAESVSRRSFLKTTVAMARQVLCLRRPSAGTRRRPRPPASNGTRTVDVGVIGAGVSGLARPCAASDAGASVRDRRGLRHRWPRHHERREHPAGGGHSLQKKYGTVDSADMIFADWTRHDHPASRYSDRDIVRKFADENAATFEFLLAHGVQFTGREEGGGGASTNAGRTYQTVEWHIPSQLVAPHRGRNGSGLVRRLEESACKSGVEILREHSMTKHFPREPSVGACARSHCALDG